MITMQSELNSQLPASGKIRALRQEGLSRYMSLGLPTRKLEDWHYTSLSSLTKIDFRLALLQSGIVGQMQDLKFDNPEFFNLIFINGKLDRLLSDWDSLRLECRLEEFVVDDELTVSVGAAHLDALQALNLGYTQQGLSLRIAKNTKISKPIQILNVLTAPELMAHPRFSLHLENGSQCSVIESYASHAPKTWHNSVCEITLEENSRLDYYRVQGESLQGFNVGSTLVNLGACAEFNSLAFATGSQLARHQLKIDVHGPNATAKVMGLTLAQGEQHIDNHTLIEHSVGGSRTEQLYKAIVAGTAKSIFTGMVKIHQNAQKASSSQLSKSLLLSHQAESNNRPQLEILADDVKATHGATVGQLDEEEIFYLLSRGIRRPEAIEMLSLGYVRDLVLQVSDVKVQQWLDEILLQAFRSGGSQNA